MVCTRVFVTGRLVKIVYVAQHLPFLAVFISCPFSLLILSVTVVHSAELVPWLSVMRLLFAKGSEDIWPSLAHRHGRKSVIYDDHKLHARVSPFICLRTMFIGVREAIFFIDVKINVSGFSKHDSRHFSIELSGDSCVVPV